MAHLRHPVFGDPARRTPAPGRCLGELKQVLRGFKRQALHAKRLELEHPATGRQMRFSCPIPGHAGRDRCPGRRCQRALARPDQDDHADFDDYDGFDEYGDE